MNPIERKMVDTLKDLRDNHGVVGVKAEFEAEGTRLEEALRLKEVITKAGLDLTLKIGGCEAVRDLYEARTIGVERIVAPMVESPFALRKFLRAVDLAFPEEERDQVQFCVNVETITAVQCMDEMLSIPEISRLGCIVVGRGDMAESLDLTRDDINSDQIFALTEICLLKAKSRNLETTIGGGVSAHSLPFFRKLPERSLDRYETRKVIFGCPRAIAEDAEDGILKAVGFELLWLKNKRNFYNLIAEEDSTRISTLEKRYSHSIQQAGGFVE